MGSEVNGILVAAHDLKAPLSLLRQLALSLELTSEEQLRKRIQTQIIDVSERAMRQVNDLAKIARLEDGLFEMEPVSVRGVCDEIYRELKPLFKFESRQLRINYMNRSRLAIANRELLYSVIYNFCTNAMHYSTRESTSLLTISDVRSHIRVGVRDFGPALPTQVWRDLNHAQLNRPTAITMRPGSSGLGLYIAAQFAQHMHAQVGAVRHHDGTSFFVDLPISQQATLF